MKNSKKSVNKPEGYLSCSENASKVRTERAGPDGGAVFRTLASSLGKRNLPRTERQNSDIAQ